MKRFPDIVYQVDEEKFEIIGWYKIDKNKKNGKWCHYYNSDYHHITTYIDHNDICNKDIPNCNYFFINKKDALRILKYLWDNKKVKVDSMIKELENEI